MSNQENIGFDASEIMENEASITFANEQIVCIPRDGDVVNWIQNNNNINFGDQEIQAWNGNHRGVCEMMESLYPNYSSFEIARHLAVVGRPSQSLDYLAKAYQTGEINIIKESSNALEEEGVPELLANYFRGAFLLRIGEPESAREILEATLKAGDLRSSMQYLYLILKHGGESDLGQTLIVMKENRILDRYVAVEVATRCCREDDDFETPIVLMDKLIQMGCADIAQAIIAQIIVSPHELIYYQERSNFQANFLKYYSYAQKMAKKEQAFKIPLCLSLISESQHATMELIDSLPKKYLGRRFLEALFSTIYANSKYRGRQKQNLRAIQKKSNLYSVQDSAYLLQVAGMKNT